MADTEVKTQMDPKQTTDGNSNLPICIYTNPEVNMFNFNIETSTFS